MKGLEIAYPKGPCTHIDILWPQSTQIGTTLRPKYIYLGTWTLRDRHGSAAPARFCDEIGANSPCPNGPELKDSRGGELRVCRASIRLL